MPTEPERSARRTVGRARRLRKSSTVPEQRLWTGLRNGRLAGLKFRRQHPIGAYVVDFYCDAARLVVEVDGESHNGRGRQDRRRTLYLTNRALRVIRVSNDDVLSDLENVLIGIGKAAGVDLDAWLGSFRRLPGENTGD